MTSPIAQRLRDAAAALPAGPVSIGSLAQAHGSAAHGSLLLLMAAPCLLPVPGVGTLLGVGIAVLAAAMWRGDAVQCLPRRVADFEMSRPWAQRVLRLLASTYAMASRFSKVQFSPLGSADRRPWIAATVGLMALIVVLPIPFGNMLPALAMMFIGLGLVFRDGVVIAMGCATAGLALLLTVGLVSMVWVWGSDWAMRWVLP
ncbi:MAG: exopolysaccharide biosynthesis protein [Caldimonas sp.]